ncbi:MAG: hypothetical protein KC506_03520, partial [Nanoarchaeota archaeon]|nr:hypothetical protein [Nanoarchaeota archaeon]
SGVSSAGDRSSGPPAVVGGVIVVVGLAAAALLAIIGYIGLSAYSGNTNLCTPSPMCDPAYCLDNPKVCNMFGQKPINCC